MSRADVQVDHDKREYYVIERDTQRVIATYRYKPHSETSRGIAAGRANMHREAHNRNENRKQTT